jgi:hypothetical protein
MVILFTTFHCPYVIIKSYAAHTFHGFFLVSRFFDATLFRSVCGVINFGGALCPLSFEESFEKRALAVVLRVKRPVCVVLSVCNTLSVTVCKIQDNGEGAITA